MHHFAVTDKTYTDFDTFGECLYTVGYNTDNIVTYGHMGIWALCIKWLDFTCSQVTMYFFSMLTRNSDPCSSYTSR